MMRGSGRPSGAVTRALFLKVRQPIKPLVTGDAQPAREMSSIGSMTTSAFIVMERPPCPDKQLTVMPDVRAVAQDFEIIVRIVQSITVAMMNVLAVGQCATQPLLHFVAMLVKPLARLVDFNFPVLQAVSGTVKTSCAQWFGTRMIQALHGHCATHALDLCQQGVKRKCLL